MRMFSDTSRRGFFGQPYVLGSGGSGWLPYSRAMASKYRWVHIGKVQNWVFSSTGISPAFRPRACSAIVPKNGRHATSEAFFGSSGDWSTLAAATGHNNARSVRSLVTQMTSSALRVWNGPACCVGPYVIAKLVGGVFFGRRNRGSHEWVSDQLTM